MNALSQDQQRSELLTHLVELKPYFWRSFCFSLAAAALVLVPTFYMLEVYDRVINSRNHLTLAMLTLLVLLAYLVMELLEWTRTELLREASDIFDRRMAPRVFQAMFDARLKRSVENPTQPMNDFYQVRDFFSAPAVLAAMESPLALLFLVIIFFIHPIWGWAALLGAAIQVLISWLNERSSTPPLLAATRAAMAAQHYVNTTLRNAEVIKAMGMLGNIRGRWVSIQNEFLRLQTVASERANTYQTWSRLLQTTVSSLMLGLGAWLILQNELKGGPGMLIVGSVLGGRVLAPLIQVITQWRSIVTTRDACARLDNLLNQVPSKPAAMPLPAPQGRLVVESIMASVPGTNTPIIKNVQLGLQPGEVLAVVGPSASGKSTLGRLLVGIWPTLAGKVRLDGVDVFTWDKSELGRYLGYLPQTVELLEGSVAENIGRFGELQLDKIVQAAKTVGLHDFILSLPDGYHTQIGREGAVLSGGQRQRVGLARAVYGEPVLVVLDEPNSSLDEEGDQALIQAIALLKSRGTTFVVMTHRTNILSVTDKILLLKEGQQQAFGPRDEVLAAMAQTGVQAPRNASVPPQIQTALPLATAV